MTLVMTVVVPFVGVWQSVDFRVSVGNTPVDDDWIKHAALICRDGAALIGFMGRAQVIGGVPVMEWLRRTVTGIDRPLRGTLGHVVDRANAEIATTREPLVMGIGATTTNGVRFFDIANFSGTAFSDRFRLGELDPGLTPRWLAGGSGSAFIGEKDRSRIYEEFTKPSDEADFVRLLSSLNRQVAQNERAGVSPWAHVVHVPVKGFPLSGETFAIRGERAGARIHPFPVIVFGKDLTEIARQSIARASEDLRSKGRSPINIKYSLSMGALMG